MSYTEITGGPVEGGLPLTPVIVLSDGGPWAQHSMPCAVCSVRHAVLDLAGGFNPCWTCQALGWRLEYRPKRKSWWRW